LKRRAYFFLLAILTAVAGCGKGPSSGDRVLVAKFLYDTPLAKPERFNVVVFKYPRGPLDEKNVPKNYIKRLLGLPGEILAIFFGRLYHIPAPEEGLPPFFDDMQPNDGRVVDADNLWQDRYMHSNSPELHAKFALGAQAGFRIVRKPPDVMLAMRRIVYDNDFPAKDLKGPAWQRWLPAKDSGWTPDNEHGFAHAGASKDAIDWLRYRHVIRPTNSPDLPAGGREPELITDFMSYNSYYSAREGVDHGKGWSEPSSKTPSPNWVGDLMLECNLEVTKSEGEFWMELSRGVYRYRARWELASGMCTLYELRDGKMKQLGDATATRVKAPGTYQIRFANIDARLTVWVDRQLPFDEGVAYPPPDIRGPDEKDLDDRALNARRGPTRNDLQPASLGSMGGAVRVHNIRLWRDTYYSQRPQTPGQQADVPMDAGDWSNPDKWSGFKSMPVNTMYVQPGHYLCLGDNSQQSSDSREWGVVPHRLMLGRALVVYFPINRAGPIR
jgi:signal peptidase I